jgi:hypothetical protein
MFTPALTPAPVATSRPGTNPLILLRFLHRCGSEPPIQKISGLAQGPAGSPVADWQRSTFGTRLPEARRGVQFRGDTA